MYEVLRPGVFFEEKKSPRAYVTVFTFLLDGLNNYGMLLLFSRTEVLKSPEAYIQSVQPST